MWMRPSISGLRRSFIEFVKDEEGSPLVEFTILAPIFLMVTFGVIQWGNIYFVQNNMLLASRMAVRAAAVGTISVTAANPAALAVAVACGSSPNPSTPLTGSPYTYTFTFKYNTGCAGLSDPSNPSYGLASMQISTPAAKAILINYLGMIGASTKLNAAATMQQEYVCPAAAATPAAISQKC